MKIKTKQTTEVEVEISLPAFYKFNDGNLYYGVYSENVNKWSGAVIASEDGIRLVKPKIILDNISDCHPISEADFNAFTENTLHKIQSLFYQTVNQ